MISCTVECENVKDIFLNGDNYLDYALRDTNWIELLKAINIDLYILYDSGINYWSTDQIADMCVLIKNILITNLDTLKKDAIIILTYFEKIVANKGRIYVF